jgi:hypothetical protein
MALSAAERNKRPKKTTKNTKTMPPTPPPTAPPRLLEPLVVEVEEATAVHLWVAPFVHVSPDLHA